MMRERDYHKILSVPKNASKDQIRKAYKRLAFHFHPDRNKEDGDLFLLIQEAYEALMRETPSPTIKLRPSIYAPGAHKAPSRVHHNLVFVKEHIRKRKRPMSYYLFATPKVAERSNQCMRCFGYGLIETPFRTTEECPLCRGTGKNRRSG